MTQHTMMARTMVHVKPSDKDFFWGQIHTLEELTNSIEYFTEEAMERDSEDFTPEQLQTLKDHARKVQAAAEEIIKRVTLPGNYPRTKRVVRFKRRKDGTVVRLDGTEVCKVCGDFTAPGQIGWHYRTEHRLEEIL